MGEEQRGGNLCSDSNIVTFRGGGGGGRGSVAGLSTVTQFSDLWEQQ